MPLFAKGRGLKKMKRTAENVKRIIPAYEIIKIVKSGVTGRHLKQMLEDYHSADIAKAMESLTPEERRKIYTLPDTDYVAEIIAYCDDAAQYMEEMESTLAAEIVKSMDSDDAADIMENLSDEKRKEIGTFLDDEAKNDIRLINSFEEDEVGSLLTTNFIVIKKGSSVKEAMKTLISEAAENDNIMTIYVENADGTYYGAIELKDIITARENDNLEDKIVTSYPFVYAYEKTEDCFNEIKEYSEDSIPVLNRQKKIIGVITLDDIVEYIDEQMGEDYAKLAGLAAEEDLNESLKESMKKRIPWLLVLLVLGLVVSSVVGIFEGVVSQIAMVVCFQSLILDMAGNVGTQSLAVTIRVLTDENLSRKEILHLIFKEVKVGMSGGFVLGSIAFVAIGIYIAVIKAKTLVFAFAVSACIGISLMLAMAVSSFMGTVIPIFFKSIKVDPAVASGPLITTVNDLVAVITYYGLVWIMLINCLHLGNA